MDYYLGRLLDPVHWVVSESRRQQAVLPSGFSPPGLRDFRGGARPLFRG
jgi:hypothetical protein